MIHISQTTLLFNSYLLTNYTAVHMHVATASATPRTPIIFKHSAAISNVFIFFYHTT